MEHALHRKPHYGIFIPIHAGSGYFADIGHSVFDLQRFADHRVPPVGVLEPVCGWRHAQQLRTDFRPKVAGQPNAFRLGERSRAEPAGDAANLHYIRHHVIRRLGVDGVLHVQGAP